MCVRAHLSESGLFVRSDVGSAHGRELLNGAFAVRQRSSQTCKLGPTYKTHLICLMKSTTQLNLIHMQCVHTGIHITTMSFSSVQFSSVVQCSY